MMKKSLGLLTALCLTACEPIPVVDFKDSMPNADTTKVELPKGSSGQGGLATAEQALQGEGSGMFGLTLASVLVVNGLTLHVLAGLSAVASQEPTQVEGDTATFGPHTPFLSQTTWLLTVTRTANNVFEYNPGGQAQGLARQRVRQRAHRRARGGHQRGGERHARLRRGRVHLPVGECDAPVQ
ncbi:hypothetical protein [Hyalangium sp.]|uniref:hypothetical protein n=1 Tax=Hyalangium sp. TaxID=2028555 RepID=UPI002D2E5F36|nr:hypothetical protein [Hyalangium sp.]HYI01924.1 hypothetical protein [Hyalangium sp.]